MVASSELSTFSLIACTSHVSLKARAVEGKGAAQPCLGPPARAHTCGLSGLPLGPSPAHGTVTAWAPLFFRTVSAPLGPSLLTVNFRVVSQVPGQTWFKGAVLLGSFLQCRSFYAPAVSAARICGARCGRVWCDDPRLTSGDLGRHCCVPSIHRPWLFEHWQTTRRSTMLCV